ncbi:hypothetical protein ACHAXT_010401 [Thalassiosira profunda]
MSATATVKLNVGGKLFEVSRALIIDEHPDTVLANIELPITLPRSMFDRELDYYGIPSTEGITNQESLTEAIGSFAHMKSKHDMFHLALECYYQFGQALIDNPRAKSVSVSIEKDHKLYTGRWVDDEEKKMFDGYLGGYFGLARTVPGSTIGRGGQKWSVRRKEDSELPTTTPTAPKSRGCGFTDDDW